MEKSRNLKDKKEKEVAKLVVHEVEAFRKLVKGHEKILEAIGKL